MACSTGLFLGLGSPVHGSQDLRQVEEVERREAFHPTRRLVQLRLVSPLPCRDHPLPLSGGHSRTDTPYRDRRLPVGLDQPGNYGEVCASLSFGQA